MSLLFAPCRRRLDCSSLRLLYRQLPETSQFRCASSSRTFQLDPLLVEVLNAPEKRFTKSKPVDLAKADLPLVDEWRRQFPALLATNHRVSIRNPKTASQLANAFIPDGSEGKVVIEAFPGPGQLTRALLKLPKRRIKRLIVMEDYEPYLEYLRPLEQLDPRVKVIPRDGYAWDSYGLLEDLGVFNDVPTIAWKDGVHPQLQFISHLPSTVLGEQLISQLFRSIPNQQWLFRYGRVPLNFLLSEYVWKRISAMTHNSERCKVSVVAEAVASCTEALPATATSPYEEHFHPVRSSRSISTDKRHNGRRVGNPFRAIQIVPLDEQVIRRGQLDKWDFCLRRLFVKKATPFSSALSGLGPGAQSLIKKITDPRLPDSERMHDVKKVVRELTVHEWSILLKAFDEWPFAPQDLAIGESFV